MSASSVRAPVSGGQAHRVGWGSGGRGIACRPGSGAGRGSGRGKAEGKAQQPDSGGGGGVCGGPYRRIKGGRFKGKGSGHGKGGEKKYPIPGLEGLPLLCSERTWERLSQRRHKGVQDHLAGKPFEERADYKDVLKAQKTRRDWAEKHPVSGAPAAAPPPGADDVFFLTGLRGL